MELTERIGRKTGGLSVSPFVSDVRGTKEPLALIMISGKAMADKAGDLLQLFQDVLLTARLDDQERFKQVTHLPSLPVQQLLLSSLVLEPVCTQGLCLLGESCIGAYWCLFAARICA